MTTPLIPSPHGTTRLFVIIGDPVVQVKAPPVMNQYFADHHVDAVMVPVHAHPDELSQVIEGLKRIANLDGMLVTIPHKFAVCALVDKVNPGAALAGSANALRRESDGTWTADNFDGRGFVVGLCADGHDPRGRRVALVGAGGAGGAIAAALVEAGISHLSLTDLSDERATAVAARLNGRHPDVISIHAAPVLHDVDLAINCTPLGLREEDPLPFAVGELRADAVVADIIMKPAETRLLKAALQRGLQIHHGVHMLNSQVDLYREFFRIEIGDAKVHRT